jgi:formylglycine-generating enzyme required for sulfatase activity
LQISNDGRIQGTPTEHGSFSYQLTLQSGTESIQINGSIYVAPAFEFVTTNLDYWLLEEDECQDIDFIGYSQSSNLTVSIYPAIFPVSASWIDSNTIRVCAKPSVVGKFYLTVTVQDACQEIFKNYDFNVYGGTGGGGGGGSGGDGSGGDEFKLSIDCVEICDEDNSPDPVTGYGWVDYCYKISRYEITNAQYAYFLNEVAASTDSYNLYDSRMSTHIHGGIVQYNFSGGYTYITKNGYANRPVTFVNWFDAARFVNWLANGQPSGSQDASTTENGAYPLNGAQSGIIDKQAINPNTQQAPLFWIPSEDEWYKAAYYKGGGTNAAYWEYPTLSDALPGNSIGGLPNQANFVSFDKYSATQSPSFSTSLNYLLNVGSYSGSASPYGTFDQGGNVAEWNDAKANNFERGIRGGSWMSTLNLHKGSRSLGVPNSLGDEFTGFRISGAP